MNLSSPSVTAPAWAVLLGDASYSIYLIHVMVMDGLYKIFKSLTPQPSWWLALLYVFVILASIYTLSLAFHIVIEKRLIRFFHKAAQKIFRHNDGVIA